VQTAKVGAVDEDGDTALHLAVMRGHYDVIISLLRSHSTQHTAHCPLDTSLLRSRAREA
jgi:ankyrin repeat protein